MTALFGFNTRAGVRDATTTMPDLPLSLPYEMRTEMNWVDFSGTSNPLGTPKSFLRAMYAALSDGELCYEPDRDAHAMRTVLSRRYGLPSESFLCGSSVSDLIRATAQTFQSCKVGIATPAPVEYFLAVANAGHETVELASRYSFVVPDANSARKTGQGFDAAVLANPSYPTSRLLPETTLLSYLDCCKWVVVDETLNELTLGGESVVSLTSRYRNLIVIRSFSAAFAMPGVPISYCIAHPDVIAQIEQFYDGSAISMFAEVLSETALKEAPFLEQTRDFLDSEIPWMQCMLNLIPGISIFPAEANFVMCSYENGESMDLGVEDTNELILRLQLSGFLVRKLEGVPGIVGSKYFCVAVRSREDNEKLLAALREIVLPKH